MAQDRFVTVYSTTSPQDSGLFGYLLPIFQAATGLNVEVAAVGTGEALALGRRGYADALFVHDRASEDKFIADGYGVDGREVMYNDFVIVGPSHDPAHIGGLKDVKMAFWANFKNRRALVILTEGDPRLFNPYSSILVNPAKWPLAKYSDARIWHEWLTSKAGVDAITSYKVNGEQLFFPPRREPAFGESTPSLDFSRAD